MTEEKRKEFTRRIAQSNRSQLIVIDYEIFLTYIADAKAALSENEKVFAEAINKAQPVISHLIGALNFEYELSYQLLNLYRYILQTLAKARIRKDVALLEETEKIIEALRKSFEEVSKQDVSGGMMKNTQKVYAGLTYGRESLNESFGDNNSSRGFLA